MKSFANKIAVVTGAASGIGRAMAERFAASGMKIVLADIEAEALASTEREMKATGADVLPVVCDVANADSVARLAERTLDVFGAVHIVCNNAGVGSPPGLLWERTLEDWQWVLGVNLWGVIHGIRTFVPILLSQGVEGHIVNTASMAGLISSPLMGIYNTSKHAVVAISETLHAELAIVGSPVKVSVLCPGFVQTRIVESGRNRPASLASPDVPNSPLRQKFESGLRQALAAGMQPAEIAERVFQAVQQEKLYILTHAEYKEILEAHFGEVLAEQNPNPLDQAKFFERRNL